MAGLRKKEKSQLEQWIGRKCHFVLMYKATRDGCSATSFHTNCDNQGPTVTVLYNTDNSVFGGYTSQSWTSARGQYVNDAQAFLFRLTFNGQYKPLKFPIKQGQYQHAICCNPNYGPTFGTGHDIYTFTGTINKSGTYFLCNGNCNFGLTYDTQGQTANNISNGHCNFTDIEVYSVKDGAGPSLVKEEDKPWKEEPKWERKTMDQLKEQVSGYQPFSDLDIPAANILLLGQVGAGKSSFFNSVTSIFRGKLSSRAPSGSAEHSITTTFRMYPIRYENKSLNFRLCDTRGLEDDLGLDSHDICYILDGNIPDRYQFNPSIPICSDVAGFIERPRLKDKIHCVTFVVDASTLDVLSDKITQRLKELQTRMNQKGVPQVIYLTKLDKVCTLVDQDVSNMFKSTAVKEAVDKAAAMFGLPRSHVLPAKNYEKESGLNTNVNILVLQALQRMLDFADDFLEEQLDRLQCENLHEMNIKE